MGPERKVYFLVLMACSNLFVICIEVDFDILQEKTIVNLIEPPSESNSCGSFVDATYKLASAEKNIKLVQELIANTKYKISDLQASSCNGRVNRNLNFKTLKTNDSEDVQYFPNCYQIKKQKPLSPNGVYIIWPTFLNRSVEVFCDMDTTSGGWTVFQRRREQTDGQENFYRGWKDYKNGFGNITGEFWLGNDVIHALTNEANSVLRVDMEDFEGHKRYAVYHMFEVSAERKNYKLKVGFYYGNAGDSMEPHSYQRFHTFDNTDAFGSDDPDTSCADKYKGGWWYIPTDCHFANPNGKYMKGGKHKSWADGIDWKKFRGYQYSLKKIEMKVKPFTV